MTTGATANRDALVARFGHLVVNAVRRIPQASRDDVIQDAWMRTLSVLRFYDPDRGTVESVILGCTRLAVIDFWRRYYRRLSEGSNFRNDTDSSDFMDSVPSLLPSPEAHAALAETLRTALAIAFGRETLPHHTIAFGYVKLLDWPPIKVVRDRESCPLSDCHSQIQLFFQTSFPVYCDWSEPLFKDFTKRLRRRLSQILSEAKCPDCYRHLLSENVSVGNTSLIQYFTKAGGGSTAIAYDSQTIEEKSDQVAHWWYSVRRRILEHIARASAGAGTTKSHGQT